MKSNGVIKQDIILPKGIESARFVIISDIHYGTDTCQTKLLEEVLDWCYENKEVYVFTNGDLIECATKSSHGLFNLSVNSINDQYGYIVDKFMPIAEAGRFVGMLEGNHERRIKKHANLDVSQIMASELGVPYGREGTFIYLRTKQEHQKKSQIYTMYGIHGSSGATTTGGKINAVERLLFAAEAELYFIGHSHGLIPSKIPRFTLDRGRIKQVDTHFVVTGSYLGYWGSYSQEKGYRPASLGSPKIRLHTEKHRMSVSV